MAAGLNAWGRYYLSRQLSLSMRDRELVIDRTTARCGCDYEWGVHVASYGERVGLTSEQVHSVAHRSEEHTSELQSRQYLVCRLLLEKKKKKKNTITNYKLIT